MKVTIPYNVSGEALEWAKKNCPSYITNQAHLLAYKDSNGVDSAGYMIEYYFANERDAAWFSLRWS